MSDLDVRLVPESDLDQARAMSQLVFHYRTTPEQDERRAWWTRQSWRVGSYQGDTLVGQVAALPQRISVPGGDLGCAAVTAVGVLPTHRRQGILTTLMDRLWAECASRDWPLAALWASESAIYGRYGFGMAAPYLPVTVPTVRPLALRIAPDARPLRLVDPVGAVGLLDTLYERSRRRRPGRLSRPDEWWRHNHLREVDDDHPTRTTPRVVVLDGDPGGYAIYRTGELPGHRGRVYLHELEGDTPEVELALWQYLASIDLTDDIECRGRPADDTLRVAGADLDQYRITAAEPGMWLRLADVPAALAARSWAEQVDLVLAVTDERIAANHGHWRLRTGPSGAACEPTRDPADLSVHVRDLAQVYLGGGNPVRDLVRVGLVAEHTPGSAAALDAALVTAYQPHLTDDF